MFNFSFKKQKRGFLDSSLDSNALRRNQTLRRVFWMVCFGLLGPALVLLCVGSYVFICPTGGLLCTAVAADPPWTLLGALGAAPAIWWTWVLRTTHKDQDNELARDQHVTAQLLQCLQLLQRKDEPHSQVGAVYALERLAREYGPAVAETVLNLLCAFVRTSRSVPETVEEAEKDELVTSHLGLLPPPEAVQTALDVIGRLPLTAEQRRIDLSKADLRRATLRGHFDQAVFTGCDFENATLSGRFRFARFTDCLNTSTIKMELHGPGIDPFEGVRWPTDGMPEYIAMRVLLSLAKDDKQ